MQKTDDELHDLPRTLTLFDATMINIGSMIGSGIFIVPAAIALHVHSTVLMVAVWLLGGIVSMCGALSIAELGAMMPRAGGQFVYLREAYGSLVGFLYGWSLFIVIQTAAIAAVAVGVASYVAYFIPMERAALKGVAIGSILLLTIINAYATRLGALVQNFFTLLKIAALAAIVITGFGFGGGGFANFEPIMPSLHASDLIRVFSIGMIAVLWSYDGWIEVTYVAGEVRHPQRNIHRSLLLSTLVVIVFYVLVNLAFLSVLGLERVAHSSLVASDAATVIHGDIGAGIVAATVAISMFGANKSGVFTGARVYYAMAREGLFVRALGTIDKRRATPLVSLAIQCAWSCLLIFSGTYEELITYIIFASWVFYALSCGAVMLLRRRKPEAIRPYRTWGYPITTLVFIVFALALPASTIIESPKDAAIGAAMILSGLPAYWWWKLGSVSSPSPTHQQHERAAEQDKI